MISLLNDNNKNNNKKLEIHTYDLRKQFKSNVTLLGEEVLKTK